MLSFAFYWISEFAIRYIMVIRLVWAFKARDYIIHIKEILKEI